ANEEIIKADKAKKELIGNVSHDLRTPLTMIVGYGEMIRNLPEENNPENINVIIDEAKRLSTLVDDLLDLSKAESGKIELNKKETSLNDMLKSVYRQYENYCRTQNVRFELRLAEDRMINIDEHRITQVLYNFINNALNYNDKEDREIILGQEKHGDKTRVYVYDNGQGIADENISKVWDRYYKVDKEHKRAHLGSGIGLSLSRELLEAHGLEYGVESKEGEYSRFYFEV
ncbi:MAG: HAMP domain-containing histidine kinase, partial [Erysipelotrichaceae bacterium]|nr:HAMP domain-containing histidine kinase [Erysipelotrichaceae bacterium]